MFSIRPYHPSDLFRIYRICLLTGNLGEDATHLYTDTELMGHFWAAPYAVSEPDLCFVATLNGVPYGYILGTRDSSAFAAWCEREWFPVLRERYPLPDPENPGNLTGADIKLIQRIHRGISVGPVALTHPAHLHIDLLPECQGQGIGRRIMETFLARLRSLGVPAVHLGVNKGNLRAVGYYEHMGFERLSEDDRSACFGMILR
jgi:ribosomal protein S18 acetylase RimI-like enzyme